MTTDAVGGVWRYTLDLAAGFAARGVGAVVAVLGPPPTAAQREEAISLGVRLIETGLPLDWTAESPAAFETESHLRDLARSLGVSSAHLHAPALAASGSWIIPVAAVAHSCVATWWRAVRGGEMPADFVWRTGAAADGLRAAHAVIAPSAAHAGALHEVYGLLPVQVVHNGSAPAASPAVPRERAVLTAGRLWDEGKGVACLDRAAAELDAPVRAAGPISGPNGTAAHFAHLDLLGPLDPAAMHRAYAGASVFASMARYEPFGLSVLEAALAGMRLVLSDIPTFRELWDGAATFVSHENDLAPALRHALDSPPDGRAREAASRYTLDATVERTLAVHRTLGALV